MKGKFICPPLSLSQAERKHHIIRQVEEWFRSDAMSIIVKTLGRDGGFSGNDIIQQASDFFCGFDFRKGKERAQIKEDLTINVKKEQFYQGYLDLGMIDNTIPSISDPDFILILGGANEANLTRTKKAKAVCDDLDEKPGTIAALSGFRVLNAVECERMSLYSKGETEFEVLSDIMKSFFDLV